MVPQNVGFPGRLKILLTWCCGRGMFHPLKRVFNSSLWITVRILVSFLFPLEMCKWTIPHLSEPVSARAAMMLHGGNWGNRLHAPSLCLGAPWNVPIEVYNFFIAVPLTKEKTPWCPCPCQTFWTGVQEYTTAPPYFLIAHSSIRIILPWPPKIPEERRTK